MYKAIFLLALLLGLGEGDKKDIFTSPLEIPLTLSANFGELRPGHFHSGLDFKTNGVIGKKVFSVSDGYIYRISVGPGGFGNAIYIRHSNGLSTVYGHLDRFTPEIEEYVTEYQYRRKSFSVNIQPESNRFRVKQGQLIAFSGNAGSSFGPHLHFEVRRSSNENPINPIDYFELEDDIKPVINQVSLYPIGKLASINGKDERVDFSLIGSRGNYRLNYDKVIEVSGEFGVGITTWDFASNSWNKVGVRSIELRLDSITMYSHSIDEFSFSNTRYINSHIDFQEYSDSRTYIQKTFLEPHNNLSIYNTTRNRGKIKLEDIDTHIVEIIVNDYFGNRSDLSFKVRKSNDQNPVLSDGDENSRIMPFNERNEYIRHDIRLSFPEKSFYDTIAFNYMKTPGDTGLLADIHYVHDTSIPVHKHFNISIKPTVNDTSLLSKACIVSINKSDISYVGGKYSEGFVTARLRSLGVYSIGLDTVPPVLEPMNFKLNDSLTGRNELRIRIEDDFSGISHYEGTIDGEWALFEWDPKNDLITYSFDKGKLTSGNTHNLELLARDGVGNEYTYKTNFYW